MTDESENVNTNEGLDKDSSGEAPVASSEVQEALASKQDELKAINDKYLRLAAEFDNYKRLAQRDQRDQIRFGNEQLLKELLPVVDNLERAIKAAKNGGGGDGLVQGVDLTLKQLTGALGKFGVQAIATVGHPFDPSGHQAVASVPSENVPEQHVVEEYQRGYRLHDRVLRAAMVTVSTGSPPNEAGDATPTS